MCLPRPFLLPLVFFILLMTLSPGIALGQCDSSDLDFDTSPAADRGSMNPGLPRPHQVHAVPMCPHEILLAWFKRNPKGNEVGSHDYRHRVRGANTWSGWTNRRQDPLPDEYPEGEMSVYNSVVLSGLDAGTAYDFEVRSVAPRDAGKRISAAVSTSATAVGPRTISIAPLSNSLEAGDPLRFEVSRQQPHGRLNVMVRVNETGNLLTVDHGGRNWYSRLVTFRDGETTAALEVYTDARDGGSAPDSEVTVQVTPSYLHPYGYLYDVHESRGSVTLTVQASDSVALSVADAEATEGVDGTLDFVLILDPAPSRQVTVDYSTEDRTATEGEDYTEIAGTLIFEPGQQRKTLAVPVLDDAVEDDGQTFALVLSNPSGVHFANGDSEALGTIRNTETTVQPALTASFEGVPADHDGGTAFTFRVAFSESLSMMNGRRLRDDVVAVSGGRATSAGRVDRRRDLWELTVEPDSRADVTVTLSAGAACGTPAAICTSDGRSLSEGISTTVAGPADEGSQPNTPATGAPTVGGTPQVGGELTASTSGISDADGLAGVRFAYQWIRGDRDISGATGLTYTAVVADQGERLKVRVSFTDDAGNAERLTSAATEAVAAPLEPLTASFEDVPAEHDGESAFTLRIASSDRLSMMNGRRLREDVVAVSGGRATSAGRVNRRRDLWWLTVQPDSSADVTVTVAVGAACGTPAAVCTKDGRALSNTLSATVRGPVGIAVADARVQEAAGAVLAFTVSLSRAPGSDVTVDYATSDGTAQAGADYESASGTLTITSGSTSGTIDVRVLDDSHDDGGETLILSLSNASTGVLTDSTAIGTIENKDALPAALVARFGRTAAVHVVDQVEQRVNAPRAPGFDGRIAGRAVDRDMGETFALDLLRQLGGPRGALARPAGAPSPGGNGLTSALVAPQGSMQAAMPHRGNAGPLGPDTAYGPGLGGGPILQGSGFALNRATSSGGVLSFWSRSASSSFYGQDGPLALNGDVRSTMFGADYSKGRMITGVSLAHSRGFGRYAGVDSGRMTSAVTGLYPWIGFRAHERVTVWTVAGYGAGGLLLNPGAGAPVETGLSMAMAAGGGRGELLATDAGFELAFKADALWVGTRTDAANGPSGKLNATRAGVTRLRTALEGSRTVSLAARMALTPSVELGIRQDGGDAEVGRGIDVGLGLVLADGVTGLAVDVRVRRLLVHEAAGFAEHGMAVSVSYDPTPKTPLGFTARVSPAWGGDALSGSEALWGRETMGGLGQDVLLAGGSRLDTEVGYGLPLGARFVGTPRVGVRTSEYGQDYRFGYGVAVLEQGDVDLQFAVDAERRVSPVFQLREASGAADQRVLGTARVSW